MYHEHHATDASGPQRALEFTEEALAAMRRAARAGLISPERHARLRARLERRRMRLLRGLSSQAQSPELPARLRDANRNAQCQNLILD